MTDISIDRNSQPQALAVAIMSLKDRVARMEVLPTRKPVTKSQVREFLLEASISGDRTGITRNMNSLINDAVRSAMRERDNPAVDLIRDMAASHVHRTARNTIEEINSEYVTVDQLNSEVASAVEGQVTEHFDYALSRDQSRSNSLKDYTQDVIKEHIRQSEQSLMRSAEDNFQQLASSLKSAFSHDLASMAKDYMKDEVKMVRMSENVRAECRTQAQQAIEDIRLCVQPLEGADEEQNEVDRRIESALSRLVLVYKDEVHPVSPLEIQEGNARPVGQGAAEADARMQAITDSLRTGDALTIPTDTEEA